MERNLKDLRNTSRVKVIYIDTARTPGDWERAAVGCSGRGYGMCDKSDLQAKKPKAETLFASMFVIS